jgi:hypothetical protein
MNVLINKDKAIGKVLFVVEGGKTEPYILRRIFTRIFDYQYETILRDKGYKKYNSKENPYSQVFVVNAEESNIRKIERDNQFLNNLFAELIENYDFDLDNAAIYYIFDRDNKSNTDDSFIEEMINVLGNARDNSGYDRQGMLLLSYPAIESFTVSNFVENSFHLYYDTGHDVKVFTSERNINHQKISEDTLERATKEMLLALKSMDINSIDLDDFSEDNKRIFDFEESEYSKNHTYQLLSLLTIALLDLGLIVVE